MATIDTGSAGVDYILILWRRLRLYLDVCMAHGLIIRWRRVSRTSSSRRELWAWINWAAVDAELWLVTMVVIPPPMVHRDHRQGVAIMRMFQAGAALWALARVAAPHSDGDGSDENHNQHQWHNQVERVDTTDHRPQTAGRAALPHVLLPETSLRRIRHTCCQTTGRSELFILEKTQRSSYKLQRNTKQRYLYGTQSPLWEHFISGLLQHKGSAQQRPNQSSHMIVRGHLCDVALWDFTIVYQIHLLHWHVRDCSSCW